MTDGTQEYPPHRLLDQPEIGGLAQNMVRLSLLHRQKEVAVIMEEPVVPVSGKLGTVPQKSGHLYSKRQL